MKKIIKLIFFAQLFFLMFHNQGYAQRDTVASIVQELNTLQESSQFDSLLFLKQALRISNANLQLTDTDIDALHKAADKFNIGTDYDKGLFLRIYIMMNLSRGTYYKAIDYAKQNLPFFEKNTGKHHAFLYSFFLVQMRVPYRNSDKIGKGFEFYNKLLSKSKAVGDKQNTVNAYYVLSGFYRTIGLIDVAIYNIKKALTLVDRSDPLIDSLYNIKSNWRGFYAWTNLTGILGEYYNISGQYEKSLFYTRDLVKLGRINFYAGRFQAYHYKNLAFSFLQLNQLDSAAYYLDEGEKIITATDKERLAALLQIRSLLYLKQGNFTAADSVIKRCWELINSVKLATVTPSGVAAPDYYLALVRLAQKRFSEAASLLQQDIVRVKGVRTDLLRDYKLLGETYAKMGDEKKANEAFEAYISLQDSLLADQSRFRSLSFETEEELAQKGKAIEQLKTDKKISRILWIFSLGIVLLLIVLSFFIYQRYRLKRKANALLEKTLAELKNTQSQLVQSEKMASLGELTAGIAHEIQNPLNFVNNFSEINTELIDELESELSKGNLKEVSALAKDIKENESKINHHGKRADSIVKGMLQHSRSSTGQKELTDINQLCEEYLRLAYHGLRAKDKSFNASFEMIPDASLQKMMIRQQEIGRVILNLINNAFYAVSERRKKEAADFIPFVKVITTSEKKGVKIVVEDNGTGMSESVQQKIFQPFYTTKPTGLGTGLGLSLSYDIIQSHGGTIKVESKEGAGTMFTIFLPA